MDDVCVWTKQISFKGFAFMDISAKLKNQSIFSEHCSLKARKKPFRKSNLKMWDTNTEQN